jgi:hypothetical protein
MSCQELERLFVAGASDLEGRKHAESCPACAAADRDQQSVRQLVSALRPPVGRPALREALLAVPARTVDCENASLLIAAAMDDEIETANRQRLAFHLSRCSGCSLASETLGMTRELALPQPAPWLAGRLAASARPAPKAVPRIGWRWLLNPKSAIAFAYAAALIVMLAGFNPADLARKARTEIPVEAKSVAGAASLTLADRIGAFRERALRAALVVKSRVFGYGRAAISNAVQLVLKSEPPPTRNRPSSGQERSAPFKNETALTVASWKKDLALQENA